jgi:DNA repair protein RadC
MIIIFNATVKAMENVTNKQLLESIGIKVETEKLNCLFSGQLEDGAALSIPYKQKKKIAAISEIYKRLGMEKADMKPVITSPEDAADIMKPIIGYLDHEEAWCLYCNGARKVISKKRICVGGLNATLVDIRQVLREALLLKACSVILFHNHPSGNCKPGGQDKIMTLALKEGCKAVDVDLCDHIIIAGNEHFSFTNEGIL